jgi:uncharacterized RDD family membrane protein YckC
MDLTSRPPLASIPIRFAALLLDGLLPMLIAIPLGIVGFVVTLGLPSLPDPTTQIVLIFVALLTYVGLLSYVALVLAMWAYGLTPGKWILGIRVVKRETGLAAGFWRMVLRQVVGQWVSAVVCYLGYIWALFDPNRQTWHDKLANTLVVRTR